MIDRELGITPTVAALIAAVRRRDETDVATILHGCDDLYALAVVLADRAAMATGDAYVARVLADLRIGDVSVNQVAHRYGLNLRAVRRIARDNGIRVERIENELSDGEWVTKKGVQVWVANDVA